MSKNKPTPKISAIVCTYNRDLFLPKCLESLAAQTLSKDQYEVIVVDNNSTDNTPEIAKRFAINNKNLRVVNESKQGLAPARNCGMREARSGIAAFTDDDAIPSADWLQRLAERFDDLPSNIVAVGGEIDAVWEQPRPEWLTDRLLQPLSAALCWSKSARVLRNDEWLCEVNSAYQIEPLLKAGGFPEHLGRIGTNLLSGENAVNSILADQGYEFFYDPDIRVNHYIPASRVTVEWFRRRVFWQGVTGYYVNQYLSEKGCNDNRSVTIELPMNESAWMEVLDANKTDNLEENLNMLYNFGYILAAQNLIAGR